MREKLIERINKKDWWHVPPQDPDAYSKRGKFFSSTFAEAEFYGRPLDEPEHVHIMNPLVGDDEAVELELLGKRVSSNNMGIQARLDLDAALRNAGLKKKYDSIVLMGPKGFQEYREGGKVPRSLELNLLLKEPDLNSASKDLLAFVGKRRFGTILADPPWRFQNRTGKVAPEHKRLSRYGTMSFEEIAALPVAKISTRTSHLYLWCPNALLPEGLATMKAWGFRYKSNLVWHKIRKDGGSDGRGVGFYFRNVTELILFGVRGDNARTLAPGRSQVNFLESRKREHSRKPDEQYPIIEACSKGPYIELFARGEREKWVSWGNQADDSYTPTWSTYANHSGCSVSESD